MPSSTAPTETNCSSKFYAFSFLFTIILYLAISVVPVDVDTQRSLLSASVSVFVVNAESVYPLATRVAVDSVDGIAEVKIPFETSLLVLVQAPGYSTASRSYYSYCFTGTVVEIFEVFAYENYMF